MATARGRAYSEGRISTKHYTFMYLFKGVGEAPVSHSETAMVVLAMNHGYQVPTAFLEVANAIELGTFELKERFGISTNEGLSNEGISNTDPEDCIFWFSDGSYFDPNTSECIFIVGDAYDLWDRTEIWGQVKVAKPIWDLTPSLVSTVGENAQAIGGGTTLGPANVYTYRSPDFMLSSAQDYRKGWFGQQQHPWQATLDPERNGTFFSHQPTMKTDDFLGDYWVQGAHPKIGQYRNTLIALHSPDVLLTLGNNFRLIKSILSRMF